MSERYIAVVEDRQEIIEREIARSHMAALIPLLEYAGDILDDITDILPTGNKLWDGADIAKRRVAEACAALDGALEDALKDEEQEDEDDEEADE